MEPSPYEENNLLAQQKNLELEGPAQIEEEKKHVDEKLDEYRVDGKKIKQDNFFYKIREQEEGKHYVIEIPQIRRKYRV